MGASPDQLEREIAAARADLAATIEAIEDRVRPRRIVRDHKPLLLSIGGGIVALMTLVVVRRVRARR